ncbi:MAG: hypothetical protein C0467_18235 [Planctomycetaceae bacterium]|nr:hypothetical protein [Planctomycetaceae bacterium]
MLPPDFEERKRAAQKKSAYMRAIKRLCANGIDPDQFPYRFLTAVETEILWKAPPADVREELVTSWETVVDEIAVWARGFSEVAVYLYDAGSYFVVPGLVVAASIDAFRQSAMNGCDFYITTPDGRSGRLYDKGENRNSIRRWDGCDPHLVNTP